MALQYHPSLKRRLPFLKLIGTLSAKNLARRRAMMRRMSGKPLPGVDVADRTVGAVPIRTYRPAGTAGDALPTLVWIHGGGMVVGSHVDDAPCSRYVDELGIAVVSVGYRLAPEHPYPAAIDDILAIVDWIAADGATEGFDRERLAIGGASAGGGLTASAVHHLHDRGDAVAGQLLVYPMLDDRTVLRTDVGEKDHPVWNNRSNRFGWSSYLGTAAGGGSVPVEAVPARRTDLAGLPPAWIGVGTADLFHDEDVEYARRLEAAGVDCELVISDGMVHGFDFIVAKGDEAQAFNAGQAAFLRRVLGLEGAAR